MKALRKLLDNIKPHVSKGGRFEMLHSTYDAFETLLFVPDKTNKNGVHVRDAIDMKRTMIVVVLALVPALLFGIWNTGYQHFMAQGIAAGFWDMVLHGALRVVPIIVFLTEQDWVLSLFLRKYVVTKSTRAFWF